MSRSIAMYAGLLLAALFAAYHTWTHQDAFALADAVVIAPGQPEELKSIVYKSKKIEVRLNMLEDDAGSYVWAETVTTEPKQPQADPHGHEAHDTGDVGEQDGDDDESDTVHTESFKAGVGVDSIVAALAPFVAKRKLEIDDTKLDELDLREPDVTVTIAREGRPEKTYAIGGYAFGGSSVYVRDPDDGAVYLANIKPFRSLENGARALLERDLTGLKLRKTRAVAIESGDRSGSFAQHNPVDAEAVYWSVEGKETAHREAAAWIGKVARLRALRYLEAESEPAELDAAFGYAFTGEGGKTVRVQVYRASNDDGDDAWYARSSHTRRLVAISTAVAAELAAGVKALLEPENSNAPTP